MKKKLVMGLMFAISLTAFMPQVTWAQDTKIESTLVQTKQKADALCEVAKGAYGAASLQYAVMMDGQVIVEGGIGEDALAHKLYGIGSVSKVYTSAAVMKLVDMGKVDLDTPVYHYLKAFEMADERYKDITVRMLLNHSSGLMGSTFEDTFLFEDVDTYAHDTLLEALKGQRLKADPGAFSVYCNDGFTLAELLIEEVSGMSYTTFITAYLLQPIGLTDTKTPENIGSFDKVATSYNLMTGEALPKEVTNVIGAGGIYATAKEMSQFGQLFTGGSDVLSQEAIDAMAVNEAAKGIWPTETDNSLDYGLGWDSVRLYPFNQYGITAFMKGGDTLNYHASLIVLPQYNMSVAVTSSGGSSLINQAVGTQMLLSVLEEQGKIDTQIPPKTFEAPIPAVVPAEIKVHEGFYVGAGQMMEVCIDEGSGILTASVVGAEGMPAQTFIYTKEGVFVSPDGSAKVSFITEANDKTYLYVEGYTLLPGLGQIAQANYNVQKVAPSTLLEEERIAWEKRNGKLYYVINEKYTSATYMLGMPVMGIGLNDKTPGYMAGYEIIDANHAKAVGEIPGSSSRDQADISFTVEDGVEYMQAGSNFTISEEALETIHKGSSKCTIGTKGYARWYHVGADAAGKTMTVELPTTGAVAVYDANGMCLNHTVVSKASSITLPEGGKVVFMGEAGTVFKIGIF